MGDIFFAADLHLGHNGVIRWRTQFESDEEHNQTIIDNWNSTITKRDTIWLLGDIAFNQKAIKLLRQLRGHKHIILGNHDRFNREHYPSLFNKISGAVSFKKDFLLTHVPAHPRSVRPRYQYNIHGHTHDQPSFGEEYYNVSLEKINFKPKAFDEILKELDYAHL